MRLKTPLLSGAQRASSLDHCCASGPYELVSVTPDIIGLCITSPLLKKVARAQVVQVPLFLLSLFSPPSFSFVTGHVRPRRHE